MWAIQEPPREAVDVSFLKELKVGKKDQKIPVANTQENLKGCYGCEKLIGSLGELTGVGTLNPGKKVRIQCSVVQGGNVFIKPASSIEVGGKQCPRIKHAQARSGPSNRNIDAGGEAHPLDAVRKAVFLKQDVRPSAS